ncbi:4592_t:CDS:2, partial [Gigaspora margarita]
EYKFDNAYIGSLDKELDEYDSQSQITSIYDAQENQAQESSNILI